jgi:predicted amidohydrolase
MNSYRIALASIRFPATADESIALAKQSIDRASTEGAVIICFPERFVPGYRGVGKRVPPPNQEFLERAWSAKEFADPANTFHEKAVLCRAAENTCYFATVNFASIGSSTTSAIARPDGTLLTYQPYGEEGLLVGDIDLTLATGLLATRYKPVS